MQVAPAPRGETVPGAAVGARLAGTAARKALGAGGSRRCTWRHLILAGCLGCLGFLLPGAVVGLGRLGFLGQAGSRGTAAVPGAAGSLRAPSPPALLSRPCSSRPSGAICHGPGIPGVPGWERSRDAGNGSGRRQICASSTPSGREERGSAFLFFPAPWGEDAGTRAGCHGSPLLLYPQKDKTKMLGWGHSHGCCQEGARASTAVAKPPESPPVPGVWVPLEPAWCLISPLSQAGKKINENK